MTTLDQAFIKAFTRQSTAPIAVLPRPAALKSEEIERAEGGGRKAEREAASGQWPVASKSEIRNPKSELSNPQSPVSAFPLSSSSIPNAVWAALEQPPKASAIAECGGRKVENNDRCGMMNDELPESRQEGNKGESVPPSALHLPPSSNPQSRIPNPLTNFKPAWQVDHFSWPRVCRRLIARAADELDRLADALLAASIRGQKVLVMGGCGRGEGATTLLLCAARRLAERGIKPVLVDADLSRPRLAKRLGVQAQCGWDEMSDVEGKSLDQTIVEATSNNLALAPVREPPPECDRSAGDPSRLPDCLGILRNQYDLVLVDLGPLENSLLVDDAWRQTAQGVIDAVILVRNPRMTSEDRQRSMTDQLAASGIAVAGIVENFVAEE